MISEATGMTSKWRTNPKHVQLDDLHAQTRKLSLAVAQSRLTLTGEARRLSGDAEHFLMQAAEKLFVAHTVVAEDADA